jgi:hypothetical protein
LAHSQHPSGPEAKQLLETTVRPNIQIAACLGASIWDWVDSFVEKAAVGGQSYDAFIAGILVSAGVEAIATFNIGLGQVLSFEYGHGRSRLFCFGVQK